jgi:hypothetical protein
MKSIKNKESSLPGFKVKITEEPQEHRSKPRSVPGFARANQEAEVIRRQLLKEYGPEKRLQRMPVDGKCPNSKPSGICVSKRGRGRGTKIDYLMCGLRTVKGCDINHQLRDEDGKEYKTNLVTSAVPHDLMNQACS